MIKLTSQLRAKLSLTELEITPAEDIIVQFQKCIESLLKEYSLPCPSDTYWILRKTPHFQEKSLCLFFDPSYQDLINLKKSIVKAFEPLKNFLSREKFEELILRETIRYSKPHISVSRRGRNYFLITPSCTLFKLPLSDFKELKNQKEVLEYFKNYDLDKKLLKTYVGSFSTRSLPFLSRRDQWKLDRMWKEEERAKKKKLSKQQRSSLSE